MEIEDSINRAVPLFKGIVDSQSVVILTIFISFMDQEQIEVLASAALKSKRQEKFYKIVVAKLFMAKYLNKVDRSIFFLFYQHPQFKSIETSTTNSLAAKIYPQLISTFHQFQHTLSLFRTHTAFFQDHQHLYNFISNLFFNPDLPMPKMKRQTIAMYADTPLQQYLALLKFPNEDQWVEEPLQKLKDEIESQVVEKQGLDWMEQERGKMETMIYRGYLLGSSSSSLQDYLLEGFRTHNLVVLLLGLCSQLARTYLNVLASIDDPMMRFTEFILRATLYRNIVLALEEHFSFLNQAYSSIYRTIYQPPPSIPLFSFHRTALSMWIQGASTHHKRNEKIYCYVISKLRQSNLLARLQDRSQKMPSFYGQLKDALQFQEFSEESKEAAYEENGKELELQGFFQDNLEMYEVIAKDYQDYFLDISVNQFNVHWCGHSRQKIQSNHFIDFTKLLVKQALRFYRFLKGKIDNSFPSELKLTVLRQLLRQDLHFQLQRITCPSILRQIIESLNQQIRLTLNTMEEYLIFGEEGLAKYLIGWDFAQKDDLIAYFASKAEITEDCPPQLSFFYDLQDNPDTIVPKVLTGEEESIQSEDPQAEIYESQEQI